MDAAVEEESRPLHHGHAVSCVDEARLDVLGGREDYKTSPTFKENIKARLWYADVYLVWGIWPLLKRTLTWHVCLFPSSSGLGLKKQLLGWFPILSWLPCYSIRENTLGDSLAGLTIGVIQLPLGENAVKQSILLSSILPPVLTRDVEPWSGFLVMRTQPEFRGHWSLLSAELLSELLYSLLGHTFSPLTICPYVEVFWPLHCSKFPHDSFSPCCCCHDAAPRCQGVPNMHEALA